MRIMRFWFLKYKRPVLELCRRRCSTDTAKTIDLTQIPLERIRNFSIIAHVDHGKSTLSDRLLEYTGTIEPNSGQNQVLDTLEVERQRGITVKAQTASMLYKYKDEDYLLNLIDTPGHVDFSNEVARSLEVCQGVVLVVDANNGVQAQTVANFYLAFGKDLSIIPVINKIDLKNANPERVTKQLKSTFEFEPQDILKVSAKFGIGIPQLLEAIIQRIPCPSGNRQTQLRAVLFDSSYQHYKGAISLVYIIDGEMKVGDNITSCTTKKPYEIRHLAVLRPHEVGVKKLVAGQIGTIACLMRESKEAIVGDTLHLTSHPVEPVKRFQVARQMVYAGLFPVEASEHQNLQKAVESLVLNDPSVSIEVEANAALGQGWRLGFLGLLHLEVFSQRLVLEWDAPTVLTLPTVTYKFKIKQTKRNVKQGLDEIYINNPDKFPEYGQVEEAFEPMVLGTIIAPDTYLGPIMKLCLERRGTQVRQQTIDDRLMMQFELPLSEILVDFHDQLKSITSGYASFDYEDTGFQSAELMKLDIYLNGTMVPELSTIVHKVRSYETARNLTVKLRDSIPRQQVLIAIQCKNNSYVLARENIKAYRKDVLYKCHGGNDASRKLKLLKAQAEGKKRMRQIAKISVPTETYIEILRK